MNFLLRTLALAMFALVLSVLVCPLKALAQSTEGEEEYVTRESMGEAEQQYRAIVWEGAGAEIQLGSEAHMVIPEGYRFTDRRGTQTLMHLYGNLLTQIEQGYVEPLDEKGHWFVVFEYEDSGHVKDDEKNNLDADVIMRGLKRSDEISNKERERLELPALNIVEWLTAPHYNDDINSLGWAKGAVYI